MMAAPEVDGLAVVSANAVAAAAAAAPPADAAGAPAGAPGLARDFPLCCVSRH